MDGDENRDEGAESAKRFSEAVKKDPSAKRISDFATMPPAKDISNVKAASDLLEAELAADPEPPVRKRKD